MKEPHAAISGIIGSTCAAWIGGENGSEAVRKRSRLAALFGSVCYTFQHGKFKKLCGDLSRVDARWDICSASALAKRFLNVFKKSSSPYNAEDPLSFPMLNLTLQQQVVGPVVFRVDSRFSADPSSGKKGVHIEDFMCSLSYSLRLLQSGKVVAWYSPKRRKCMIELGFLNFSFLVVFYFSGSVPFG